jgi:predicted dehydrogenase
MEKLRMGILGCSEHYGLRVSTPLKSSLLIEPYGVASRNFEKAKSYAKQWGITKAFGSYEELLDDPHVDFIYCPLPNHLHYTYIKKSADAGKHILCEKPICMNTKEAADAAEYCEKKGVLLMEAFMYRFHPQWTRAMEIIRCGELGSIMSTEVVLFFNLKDPKNIRNIPEAGGGSIYDEGCYAVSSARFLMGAEPERVVCTLKRDPVFKTDIYASALLDFGDGRVSNIAIGTQLFFCQQVKAFGTGGTLTFAMPFTVFGDVPERIYVNNGNGQRVIETESISSYLLEYDAFAQAVAEKRTVAPTPACDAVANMAVLDALFASAASGKWEPVIRY